MVRWAYAERLKLKLERHMYSQTKSGKAEKTKTVTIGFFLLRKQDQRDILEADPYWQIY